MPVLNRLIYSPNVSKFRFTFIRLGEAEGESKSYFTETTELRDYQISYVSYRQLAYK